MSDENESAMITFPVKLDAGKPRMDLLPPHAILEVAKVLEYGASKYAANRWRAAAPEWGRFVGAIGRHLMAFMAGEDYDTESGLPHLAHLACSALFVLEFQLTRTGKDDRYRGDE